MIKSGGMINLLRFNNKNVWVLTAVNWGSLIYQLVHISKVWKKMDK